MINFIKNRVHVAIYFAFIIVTIILLLAHNNGGHDDRFVQFDDNDFSQNWTYDFGDGTSGVTTLPANLKHTSSKNLVLKNTIPVIKEGESLFYRVRHTSVKVYVDDELRINTYIGKNLKSYWQDMPGLYYLEIPVGVNDAGKEIRIESFSNAKKYISNPGNVYLGDRGSLFLKLIKSRTSIMICIMLLLFLSIMLLGLWLLSYFILKMRSNEILCLGLFSAGVDFWLMTESGCVEFWMRDTGLFTILAYEVLMLIPIPMALFFAYYSDRESTKLASDIVGIVPLIVFAINNILHTTRLVHLADSLIITQIMMLAEIIVVAYIQISEILYKYQQKEKYNPVVWKIPLVGIAILVPLSLIEVLQYVFLPTMASNGGTLISIGVLFYLISLAFDSFVRMNFKAEQFKQSSEFKSQFLANMSHEIRTPLNAILGFNEVILRITSDERVKKYSVEINEAGQNLKSIINSILDISKIESGKLHLYSVEYNTIQMFDGIVSMFEALGKKKGLTITADVDPRLPKVLIGDEKHLTQIITNIMSNAVKYTESGSVTLTVKVLEMPVEMPLCRIYVSVKDTGAGIRDEDKERLFEKFERLDREKNMSTEGTGLGMSIVVQLLQAMGTTIELDSVYGQGSDFHFELVQSVVNQEAIGSFEEQRKALALQAGYEADFIAPNAKILVVDDVNMNLEAAVALLEDTQIQMDTASSGQEAIDKIQANRYDMVLMDHMMPEMDGVEATERIRNLAVEQNDIYFANLPIIALTANAMAGMDELFNQAGMQEFVSKPIEINVLRAAIKRWLPADLIQAVVRNESEVREEQPIEKDEWEELPPCVNLEVVKQYCPKYSLFVKLSNTFIENEKNVCAKITEFANEEDCDNYRITVHGLKSAARTIGLMEVSNLALAHEKKCLEGVPQQAWSEVDKLLALYQKTIEELKSYFNSNSTNETVEVDDEEYVKLVERIKQAAATFDMGAFMTIEDELTNMNPPSGKEEEFAKIKELVINAAFGDLNDMLNS